MSESPVLAIEISQREGGVALWTPAPGNRICNCSADRDSGDEGASIDGGRVLAESLSQSRRHDVDLMPAIQRLFEEAGLVPGDLSEGAVGVSIGPGGFTGLRIAVSTAKMLAMTLGAQVVAVPSALVAIESTLSGDESSIRPAAGRCGTPPHQPGGNAVVLVALAAKRGTFWATTVRQAGVCWQIDGAGSLVRTEDLDPSRFSAVLADTFFPDESRKQCKAAGLPIIEPVFDPVACLRIACRMLAAGETADPMRLTPLYPREPEAVSLWQERGKSKRS